MVLRRVVAVLASLALATVACGDSDGRADESVAAGSSTTSTTVPRTTATEPTTTTSIEPGFSTPSLSSGTWERWATTDRIRPNGLLAAGSDNIVAITDGGVVRWDPAAETYEVIADPMWPALSPWSAVATADGDVWFGFYTAVVQWDGVESTLHRFVPTEASTPPIELAVGPDDAVWAASAAIGLQRFDGTAWAPVEPALPDRVEVDTLAVDRLGRVWVGGFAGLWVLDENSWTILLPLPVSALVAAAPDAVWFAGDGAVFADGGPQAHISRVAFEPGPLGNPMNQPAAWTAIPLGEGHVWSLALAEGGVYAAFDRWADDGTATGGLWWLDTSTLPAGEPEPLPGEWDDIGGQMLAVTVDSSGDVWVGGGSGLWRYDGESSRRYHTDTFAGWRVEFVETAPDGTPWVGDCVSSSVRVADDWQLLPDAPATGGGCAAVVDHSGTKWIAAGSGPARLDGDRWVRATTDASGTAFIDLNPYMGEEVGDEPVWSLLVTGDGTVWAAMIDVVDGLWQWADGVWERELIGGTPSLHSVQTVAAGDDGGLLVASAEAVHVFRDGVWDSIPVPEGPAPPIRSLAAGGGVVWADTIDALLRFDSERWDRHDRPQDTLPDPLMVDAEGAVWLPGGDGAMRFDGSEVVELELPTATDCCVSSISIGPDGSWWIGSPNAVFNWTPGVD